MGTVLAGPIGLAPDGEQFSECRAVALLAPLPIVTAVFAGRFEIAVRLWVAMLPMG